MRTKYFTYLLTKVNKQTAKKQLHTHKPKLGKGTVRV